MTFRILPLMLAASLALPLSACGGSSGEAGGATNGAEIANIAPPAGQTWSDVVRATEEGFVMGNPEAPLKVVEYGSFTCSHCAEFSVTGHEELKNDFINTGRVSFELRPFIRDPLDLMLAATATCAGTERFFPLAENIWAGFEEVLSGAQAAPNAAQNIGALPEAQRFSSLATAWRIDQFFAARGLPAAELNRCLGDVDALGQLEARTRAATERWEIAGTPTFLLNGTVMEGVGTWEQMKERLRAAGAR
jgi:protein-disulfide isomerase